MITMLIAAVLYACATFLCLQFSQSICARIEPFADGPRTGKPPVAVLIGGSAIVGAALASHAFTFPMLAVMGVVTAALASCWYCDISRGIVPDYFTLGPIALVAVAALLQHNLFSLISMLVVFVPFAATAYFSKGKGMGWGDVKLATLGGGLLGMNHAIFMFALACLVAVGVAWVRKRRHEPIAFAPYLVSAISVAMTFPMSSA